MSLMISKSQEEIYKQQSQEINDLKDCLKMLQREMFDIVKLKSDIYMKRFKAENFDPNDKQAFSSEEIIKNEISSIKENLFNLNFEETGKEIIQKFKINFKKLKDFMENVDKGIAQLSVFNTKGQGDMINDDEHQMTSVLQLRELIRNYEGIVESQHQLLSTSISKMGAIPPPDEIQANFNRFQVLKDEELDDMRNFLNEHKNIMQMQYQEFE